MSESESDEDEDSEDGGSGMAVGDSGSESGREVDSWGTAREFTDREEDGRLFWLSPT